MSEKHRNAGRTGWTPERREAWRKWVLENRPWERVKVRRTPEWREHLASICKKVDGYESKAFADEKRLLRMAIADCTSIINAATKRKI